MPQKLKLFISYSHKNAEYMKEFRKWLVQLRNNDFIEDWYDGEIPPGDKIYPDVDRNKQDSDLMALLLTQEYLNSGACQKEMNYAVSNSNNTTPIPIILETCTWKATDLYDESYKALPKDGKPVNTWNDENEAWMSIYKGIKQTVRKKRNTFEMKEGFRKRAAQIDFVSENKEQLKIDDVFVFPELSIEAESDYENPESKNIEKLKPLIESDKELFLIKGKDLSGKTAFAKKLYKKLHSAGYLPLMADGSKIHKTKNFDDHFRDVFNKQLTGVYDKWKEEENKAIIIDNYHHEISSKITEFFDEHFEKIFIVMDEDEYITYFLDDADFAGAALININPLSLSKQERLIRKWKKIGKGAEYQVPDKEIDQIEKKIREIIDHNRIVPRYPFYVLSILQSLETFMPHDYKITRYGHCYQALITARLAKKNIKSKHFLTCYNYLSELAYYKFQEDEPWSNYEEFENYYYDEYYPSEGAFNKLKNDEYPIIEINNSSINFQDPYVFYFFLGKYFAENPDREVIEQLCEKGNLKENTYAIIFTIHHSQSTKMLNWILPKAASIFENVPPAKLDRSETEFMHELLDLLPQDIQSDKPTDEVRSDLRDLEDSFYESQEDYRPEEESKSHKEIKRAMNMVQVLGQIAKNHSGSFPKKQIKDIVEESEKLGLRVLTLLRKTFTSDEIEEWLQKRLKDIEEQDEELSEDEKVKFIRTSINFLWFITTVAIIQKVADSVGSEELLKAIDQVTQNNPEPSYEFINLTVNITHNKINFREIKNLKEKYEESGNRFIIRLLSYYIQYYLDTHREIDFRLRDKLCNLFGLNKKNYLGS